MRLVTISVFGRIAAQRDDVPNAHIPVLAGDVVNLTTARADAGQMWCGS